MALTPAGKTGGRTRLVEANNHTLSFGTLAMLSHVKNDSMRQAVIDTLASRLRHIKLQSIALKIEFAAFNKRVLAEAILKAPPIPCMSLSLIQDFIFVTLKHDAALKVLYRKLLIKLIVNSVSSLAAYKLLSDNITMKELDQIVKGPHTLEAIRADAKECLANKLNPSAETKSKTEQSKD